MQHDTDTHTDAGSADVQSTESPHQRAQAALRISCEAAEARLDRLRADRDAMNDEIRLLVEEVATMRSALGVFDRRATVEREAAEPRRRARSS